MDYSRKSEKKTVTDVLKRFSIEELELLSKVNSKKLKHSIKTVLSTKIALRNLRDLYRKL